MSIMDAALITSAALLGLAGTPHCAAMCGAPCAAVAGSAGPAPWLFHLARTTGYAAAGAAAAASVGLLASMAQWTPALRPLWVLFHSAMLVLGLWLLWRGRQPAWMGSIGRVPLGTVAAGQGGAAAGVPVQVIRPSRRAAPAALAGLAWVAWPCGLLQSALLVASMANTPVAGGAAMAAFALASSGGLVAAPWLWRWMQQKGSPPLERVLARAAGALLVVAAAFSLGHGVWHEVAAFCGF
jgi:uncharacterized protein